MNYSLSTLTTSEMCDEAINMATEEKEDLAHKKSNLEHKYDDSKDKSVELDADLNVVNTELGALQTVVSTLPDGEAKDLLNTKIKKLEYRKFLLEERSESYGAVAVVEKELEIGMLEKQIAEVEAFIQSVTDHKATL
jgi:hypothetical protein